MSELKDDVINKAIQYTRPFRPLTFDPRSGKPIILIDPLILSPKEMSLYLIDLCLSVQRFLYGEEDHESNEHKNGEDIQSGKD